MNNNISKILERLLLTRIKKLTIRPFPTSVLISQLTVKVRPIPLKQILPLHWITSSRPLTMVKPVSQYALTSVQPSTP